MELKYDKRADAYGKDLDDLRRIDYDADGQPRGVELLCVSEGVVTDDLPQRAEIERIMEDNGIKTYA